jgi:hypothetical protein
MSRERTRSVDKREGKREGERHEIGDRRQEAVAGGRKMEDRGRRTGGI